MTSVSFLKMSVVSALANSDAGFFLTIDPAQGLAATKDALKRETDERICEYVKAKLTSFLLLNDPGCDFPKKNAITALQESLTLETPVQKELESIYYPAAQAKWRLHRAENKYRTLQVSPDEDSLVAESWLKQLPDCLSDDHFKVMLFPRDTLFLLQKTFLHIKRSLMMNIAIAERVARCLSDGNTVTFEDNTFFFGNEDADCASFYSKFKFVAKKIAKNGITGDFDSIIQPVQIFAKFFLLYKKEATYNPDFAEKCLEFLEVNEMHYYLEVLKKAWPALEFSAKTMHDIENRYFVTRSYFPLKQLKYITDIYCAFNKYLKNLDKEPLLAKRAECVRKIGYLYLKALEAANVESHLELYKELDTSILTVLNRLMPNNPMQVFYEHSRIIIYSKDCDTADNEIDEYCWADVTAAAYESEVANIAKLTDSIALKLRSALLAVETKEASLPVDRDRGFGYTPPSAKKPLASKKKKHKVIRSSSESSGSSSRSVSPEIASQVPLAASSGRSSPKSVSQKITSGKVEQLTKGLSKLSLIPSASSHPAKDGIPLVMMGVKYDDRVRRWFKPLKDPEHPHNNDPKYRDLSPKAKFWTCLEHSFAKFVDRYINFAVGPTDKAELVSYKNKERKQLIGSIQVASADINETRMGAFTYAIGDDTRIYHRWFVDKDHIESKKSKDGHFDEGYTKKAFTWLQTHPFPPKVKAVSRAIDESLLEEETDEYILISDPKNNARICLIKP